MKLCTAITAFLLSVWKSPRQAAACDVAAGSTAINDPKDLPLRSLRHVPSAPLINRNTQGCTSVAVLWEYGTPIVDTIALVNGEPSCSASLCPALFVQSDDQATIMGQLGNFDILIIMNPDNYSPPLTAANKALVETALANGTLRGLMVYDRFAARGVDVDVNIPGLGPTDVIRSLPLCDDNEPHPLSNGVPPISGPFGALPASWPGSAASHGYIDPLAQILSQPCTEQHIRMNSTSCSLTETTTIQYQHGAGLVYYSTIPMDFYLLCAQAPYFDQIFPNALCHFTSSLVSGCSSSSSGSSSSEDESSS